MEMTLSLPITSDCDEDRLAFLALPAKRASGQVTGTVNELFTTIQTLLAEIVTDVCAKRTIEEFCAARDMYFPQYVRVMVALSSLINTMVPTHVVDRLAWESMSEMEAEFRDDAVPMFGKDICDQAIFTVWTLRKIHDLANRLRHHQEPKESKRDADTKLTADFVHHILVSRFNLDCLNRSLHTGTPILPEIMNAISEGLRSLVNAYAYIKQVVDLRSENVTEDLILIDFDEEERELLADSMRDLTANG